MCSRYWDSMSAEQSLVFDTLQIVIFTFRRLVCLRVSVLK